MYYERKKYTLGRVCIFLSKPQAWYIITARSAVYITNNGRAVVVSHHASACILLRIDYIQHFVLIPYRRQAADFIHGFAVILRVAFLYYEPKKQFRKRQLFSISPEWA